MKTIIEMAREAGFEVHERKQQARVGLDALCGIDSTAKLERFAELVRADEREALAAPAQQEPIGEAQQMSEGFTHCIWDARVVPVGTKLYTSPPAQRKPLKQATIADAPVCLNTNDKAMWLTGWNECAAAHGIKGDA